MNFLAQWGLPLLKSLLGGLFGWLSRDKQRADKERVEGLKAERESIRQAALAERNITKALMNGRKIVSPDDWNAAVKDPWGW